MIYCDWFGGDVAASGACCEALEKWQVGCGEKGAQWLYVCVTSKKRLSEKKGFDPFSSSAALG